MKAARIIEPLKTEVVELSQPTIGPDDVLIQINRTFHESIMMIRSGKINLRPLVSHRLPIEDFQEGLRLAQADPHRMKVQFAFEYTQNEEAF